MKCFKCDTEDRKLVRHHIRYDPEEVVMCCRACHKKIHIKVRKEGLCPLSVEETRKISQRLSKKAQQKANPEKFRKRYLKYYLKNHDKILKKQRGRMREYRESVHIPHKDVNANIHVISGG